MNPDATMAGRFLPVPGVEPAALPAARAPIALLQWRMEQTLVASTERFDAQVLAMTHARQAAASLASAATLVDIRTFGWKGLERYGDEVAVLLDGGPAAALRFTDVEVAHLLDAASDHLAALYGSAAACLRETAHAIGMHPVPSGLEEELFSRLVHCGGRLASAVSARRAEPATPVPPGALERLRAAAGRLVRLAAGGARR